jgi:hypothetical protein
MRVSLIPSPALASSMICLAMIPSARSSVSLRARE